jgi:hypothetical protein
MALVQSDKAKQFRALHEATGAFVMYGRPPLGKGNLARAALGLERSCIRPVAAVGRPLAAMGCADRVPSIAAR